MPALLAPQGTHCHQGLLPDALGIPACAEWRWSELEEDFRDLIRESNPTLVDSSIRTVVNVVMREFDLCKRNGSVYQLSARGVNVLDSQDPQELADQLLTKVLGVDYACPDFGSRPQIRARRDTAESESRLDDRIRAASGRC